MNPGSSAAVETLGLRKAYRTVRGRAVAVDGLDLRVPAGGVHALLGLPGSGRTTTLRLLTGLAHADAGAIKIFGTPVPDGLPDLAGRIGAVVGEPGFQARLSGRRNLALLASAAGVPRARVDEVLARVVLADRARAAYGTYSTDEERRLALAAALLRDPDLLVVDEPSAGLDAVGTREIRQALRRLADQGKTVLIATGVLTEAQQIADTVTVLDDGRVLAQGTVADLLGDATVSVRVRLDEPAKAATALRAAGFKVRADGDTLHVDDVAEPSDISRALAKQKLFAGELVPAREDLAAVVGRLRPVAPPTPKVPSRAEERAARKAAEQQAADRKNAADQRKAAKEGAAEQATADAEAAEKAAAKEAETAEKAASKQAAIDAKAAAREAAIDAKAAAKEASVAERAAAKDARRAAGKPAERAVAVEKAVAVDAKEAAAVDVGAASTGSDVSERPSKREQRQAAFEAKVAEKQAAAESRLAERQAAAAAKDAAKQTAIEDKAAAKQTKIDDRAAQKQAAIDDRAAAKQASVDDKAAKKQETADARAARRETRDHGPKTFLSRRTSESSSTQAVPGTADDADTMKGDASKGGSTKADSAKADSAKTAPSKSDSTKAAPSTGKPSEQDTAKPSGARPETRKPGAPKPGTPKPDAPQPGAPKPGAPKPGAHKPGAPKPGQQKDRDPGKPGSARTEDDSRTKGNR